MKNSLILFFLAILSSCNGLKLNLKNGSEKTFKKVIIEVDKHTYVFDNLKSNEISKLIKVKGSYYFFPTKIITETGDTLKAESFCYTGEKLYKSGNLIITLTIEEFENEKFIVFKPSK